jgi:hypothetical protein
VGWRGVRRRWSRSAGRGRRSSRGEAKEKENGMAEWVGWGGLWLWVVGVLK